MGVEMTGFDALIKDIAQAPDRLERKLIVKSRKLAEKVAGKARLGAPVKTGRLRNGIEGYVEVHGAQIEGGARTSYLPAIYHEFGTGPEGDRSPHPMAKELGIAHRADGWTYQSAEAASARGEPFHAWDGEEGYGGYVYTEGVPAKAFLYNALVETEDEIAASLGDAALEVFLDK